MSGVDELLRDLHSKDVIFQLDGDGLSIDAPQGALLEQDIERIRSRKQEIIDALRSRTGTRGPVPQQHTPGDPIPLSLAQQRLWFLAQLAPDAPIYNLFSGVRLTGSLDVDCLRTALNALVARHESLRSCFPATDGTAQQVIVAHLPLEIRLIDSVDLDSVVQSEARTVFNIETGPLLEVTLVRLAADQHALLLTLHHLVADGWSMSILIRELLELYVAQLQNRSARLPALSIQYRDYTLWQRDWLRGPTLDTLLEYWKSQLRGAPHVLELPADRPRPSIPRYCGAAHRFFIPAPVATGIARLAASVGATKYMTLLAAFQILLSRLSGQRDFLLSTPVAGRSVPGTLAIVGFFVNTLAIRAQLNGALAFCDYLRQVRETVLSAFQHQDLPFDRLVAELQPTRDPSRAALTQVAFAFQPASRSEPAVPGLELEPIAYDSFAAKNDLSLRLQEMPEGLLASLEYATDLFDAGTIASHARRWLRLLAQVVDAPATPIDALNLALPARSLRGGPELLTHVQSCLHRLTAARALENPVSGWLSVCLEVHGGVDPAMMRTALGLLVEQHAALRLRFSESSDGVIQQWTPASTSAEPCFHDLVGSTAPLQPGELAPLLNSLQRQGCDASYACSVVALGSHRHLIIMSHHPLATDAHGAALMITRLAAICAMVREGRPVVACSDEDRHERWLSDDADRRYSVDSSAARNYWKTRYSDEFSSLASGAGRGGKADSATLLAARLDGETAAAIGQHAQRASIDIEAALTSAFLIYATKIVHSDDLVIGVALRPDSIERLAVAATMTLPLQVRLVDDACELARNVSTEIAQMRTHARSAAGVQAFLDVYQRCRIVIQVVRCHSQEPLENLPVVIGSSESARPELRVWAVVSETDQAITIQFDGRADAFEPWELRQLLDRFVAFLPRASEAMARSWNRRSLGLMTAAERAQLLQQVQDPPVPYDQRMCVHEAFELQVRRDPQRIALVFEGTQVSYGQLNARANQLADYLRTCKVGEDARVALCIERGIALVVGMLAILKAGGAYVPLDAALPVERLVEMVEDSRALLLLTVGSPGAALRERGIAIPVVDMELDEARWSQRSTLDPARQGWAPDARRLMYVIYTSGSTGRPKGVMVEHRAVYNYLLWKQRRHRLGEQDVFLQKAPIGFDMSVSEVMMPLISGARLVIARPDGHRDPEYLVGLIARQQVTTLSLVPSMLEVMLPNWAGCESVREVCCGGESLSSDLARQFMAVAPRCRLFNLYGPTETTIIVSSYACESVPECPVVPIGRAVANSHLFVLDHDGHPLPLGIRGELHAGGHCLARGYLNDPELTARKFVDNPWVAAGRQRLYRTGDLARWLPSGNLEFFGRQDDQVKIRGNRVGLLEVEDQLRRHPAVKEALVVASESRRGRQLIAYWTTHGTMALSAQHLRAHLRERLPDYMVPAELVCLESFPRMINGKIDRKALPLPSTADPSADFEAPEGDMEEALAGIWRDVLQQDRIGRNDNFFERGGHSLLIVRVVERLRKLGIAADIRSIFGRPVLRELASELSARESAFAVPPNLIPSGCERITPAMLPLVALEQQHVDEIVANVTGGAANVQDIYPLTAFQEGILFHRLANVEEDTYLLPSLVSFVTRERLDAFVAALQATVDRHDLLRSSIAWEGLPQAVQVVWRRAPLIVEQIDGEGGDVRGQLRSRFDPRRYRMDIRRAPLRHALAAYDPGSGEWLLMMVSHHLIGDHRTLEILGREVAGHLRGLPALATSAPFRDHVARTQQGARVAGPAEVFFKMMLGHISESCAPFGAMSARASGWHARESRTEVSAVLASRVRACARAAGVSTATLCHLAWALVAARTSGQASPVFGTVLGGRMHEGAEDAVGLFINTLPLAVDVDELSVAEAIDRTHRALANLLRYEHASLAEAQRCSGVEWPAPLFTSLLNYRHMSKRPESSPDRSAPGGIRTVYAEERTSYPITLSVTDLAGEGLALTALVTAAVAPARVCDLMSVALERIVTAWERAPSSSMSALHVVGDAEARLLESWNETQAEYPRDACIHELFQAQVRRRPRATAIIQVGEHWSFERLDQRARQIALQLQTAGVQAGDRVAVLLQRSPDLIAVQVAVLACGAAYVPLELEQPAARWQFIIEDCNARLVIATTATAPREAFAKVSRLDLDASVPQLRTGFQPPAGLHSEAAAYVMYTSGSTGRPKGVIVPHRAVTRLAINNRYAELHDSDRVAFASNPAFDASTFEVWGALLNGACVAIIDRATLLDPQRLVRSIASARITVMWLTVGLFNQYAQALKPVLGQLRYLIIGGDALDPRVVADVLRDAPPLHLLNGYGPTETTTFAATFEITQVRDDAVRIPIGRPIANTTVNVLDQRGRLAPIGVAGEICIGGDGVALGYVNQPELTAARFVDDCFAGTGRRMYRTGDFGYWSEDGMLQFLGRRDDQVKVRGFRVQLGEIEALLSADPAVREVVVVVRADAPQQERIVAYLVCKAGHSVDPVAMRDALAAQLPPYMIPAAYVCVESLPLTLNGKVDRRSLPAPQLSAYAVSGYEAPRGELEESLGRIWCELLRIERVGRGDSFFALGGHSLLAVRLLARLRQQLGRTVSIAQLFEGPTIQALAQHLSVAAVVCVGRIVRGERVGALPLSLSQQRLWFIDQLQGQSAAYRIAGAVRLSGELDEDALGAALDEIERRHEVLRTVFVSEQGEARQQVREAGGFALEVEDVRGVSAEDREQVVRERMHGESVRGFDLGAGPLIRGRLLRVEDEQHVLLITMHHIISDGWSLGVLLKELSELYGAYVGGRESPLEELPIQYADYAQWQREWLQGELLQEQLGYWKGHLAGAPALLELPTDRARPARQSHAGAVVRFALGEELSGQLRRCAQEQGVTLFMLLYAGWAVLLSRLSAQEDVVIGTAVANRARTEVEGLIGCFVNTLALRVRVSGESRVEQLLQQVRQLTLAGYAHQEAPFEQVVEVVQPPRSLSHSALFQTMLVMQNTPQEQLSLAGLRLQGQELSGALAQFDLTLSVQESSQDILGSIVYATDLFDRSRIEQWLKHLRLLLGAIANEPQRPVATLPLLDAAQRSQLLDAFNASPLPLPDGMTVHQLVRQQAQLHALAIAVKSEAESLTYAQLQVVTDQLAARLFAHGIGRGSLVGIFVERGIDVIVSMLAVWKCGAAYVPFDPGYPVERLAFMAQDAAPAIFITRSALEDRLASNAPARLLLDGDTAERSCTEFQSEASCTLAGSDLAYVIYTSGSTGQPKGVMIDHRALANLALAQRQIFSVGPDSRVLQIASPSFDAFLWDALLALCNGGCLCIASREQSAPGTPLIEYLKQERISHACMTPSALRAIPASEELPDLHSLIATGETCTSELCRLWAGRKSFYNGYGPTETTVAATIHQCCVDDVGEPPIGRPFGNVRAYVLDACLEPVPVGVAGEIYIGGAGVGRGYWRRDELTAERFLPDRFVQDPGARMYRTGDMGRWRSDGLLDYLGRSDRQVKLRGLRIELGEIETQLRSQPGVREAAVLVRPVDGGDERLIAYLECPADVTPNIAEIRSRLKAALPEFMRPGAYVRVPAFPLSPNGKLDRDALPPPQDDAFEVAGYEAPAGEKEEAIAILWQELLAVPRVSRHDNFFDLGGHSMLTVKLLARLRELGLALSLTTLFRNPTVAGLAQALTIGDAPDDAEPVLLRGGDGIPVFLVHEVSGDVLPYVPLSRLLQQRVPVYGLHRAALRGLISVEQLAAEHVRAMRRVQPQGPYRVAGWSFGALLAYEIAQQLIGADEVVEFVGMIDVFAPSGRSMPARDDQAVLLANLRDNHRDRSPEFWRELAALDDFAGLVARCAREQLLPPGQSLEQVREAIRIQRLVPEITNRYAPIPLPVRAHLFDSEEVLPSHMSRDWNALVGDRIHREVIGGTHHSIMKPPHLQRLAVAMSGALQAGPSPAPAIMPYQPLFQIQGTNSRAPAVFCVPGAGAGITCLMALAEAFAGVANVHGLQHRGLEGVHVPHSTVAAAARCYLAAIRAVAPSGPYHLIGHSYGGWIALEMALQLRSAGEQVAPVVILDSELPSDQPRGGTGRLDTLQELIETMEEGAGTSLRINAADLSIRSNEEQLALLLERMIAAKILPRGSRVDIVRGLVRVFLANRSTGYLPPQVLDGELMVVELSRTLATTGSQLASWQRHAVRVHGYVTDSNHMLLLRKPHIVPIVRRVCEMWSLGAPG